MKPNLQPIIDSIKTAKSPIAAFTLGIAAFSYPDIRAVLIPSKGHSVVIPTAEYPTIYSDSNERIANGPYYSLPLDESIEYIVKNSRNTFTFLSIIYSAALLHVGDAFARADYLDKSPEIEFMRHIRNAVAHGNRFNFTKPLKRPAAFRSYTISERLQNTKLLRDADGDGYLYEGDALALLDCLQLQVEVMLSCPTKSLV